MSDRHVILLERRQGKCGGNNYCVTFEGTLAACRARCGQEHDCTTTAWEMTRWRAEPIEPCAMREINGSEEPGVIARLERR